MYYLMDVILLLAIPFTCKGQDVNITTTRACYNVNDNMTLEAEYKGSTTVVGVIWTITGGASSMTITVATCSSPFAIPTGFPSGRMSHDCSSAPKYRLTVQTFESADFDKIWGVDFSLSTGSTSSGTQQQTIVQCETVNKNDTGCPPWKLPIIITVCVIGGVGILALCLYVICFKVNKTCTMTYITNSPATVTPRPPIKLIIALYCEEKSNALKVNHEMNLNNWEQTLSIPLLLDVNDFDTIEIGIVDHNGTTNGDKLGGSFQLVRIETSESETHEFKVQTHPDNTMHRCYEKDAVEKIQRFTTRKTISFKKNTTPKLTFAYIETGGETVPRSSVIIAT